MPLIGYKEPLFHMMAWELLTKSSGIFWNSSSEHGILSRGQSLYWYPPPWLYRMPQATRGVDPISQTVTFSSGVGGSTADPRSPIPYFFMPTVTSAKTESPPIGVWRYLPPAWPHGSTTGAVPGARQGLNWYESSSAPGSAWMLSVQNSFGSTALVLGFSQYDFRKPALSAWGRFPVMGLVRMVPLLSGCFGSVRQ